MTDHHSVVESSLHASSARRSARWLPLLMLLLAIWDLRTEFLLLIDHFTITSLIFAIRYHMLAVVVLLSAGSLWRRYR